MAQIIDLQAERRARRPTESTLAARVALRAHERGVGEAFELALGRLVRRWNQPPEDLDTLAQAAGVVGLSLDDVLDSAYDPRRDGELALRRAR
jgi:hypothetical protein